MGDRERNIGRFRVDRASGLAGSVERVQDPFGALQEALREVPIPQIFSEIGNEIGNVDLGFDPETLLSAATGIPSLAFNRTKQFLFESLLPTYVQSTRAAGPEAVVGISPLGNPPMFQSPISDDDDDLAFRSGTTRTSGRRPGRISRALDILSPREAAGGAAITNALQRFQFERYAEFQNEIKDFSRQYEERIGQLQDELTKYKGGLTDINKAYGEYATDADAILKEAASVVAEPLPDSDVVATVQASYDAFGGAMADVLKQIDANGNEALAAEMAEQATFMEDVIVDGLRSGLASQTNLHQLAGAQAQALANMAWKDDLYNAEKARFEIELQIQAQMSAKQEQITTAQDEMNRAIADATAQFENELPSPDELWNYALDDYFKVYGLNEIEAADLRDMWDDILNSNPQALENYETFKGEVQLDVNKKNLMRAGLWDDFERRLAEGWDNPDTVNALINILETRDLATDTAAQAALSIALPGTFREDLRSLQQRASIKDKAYTSVLDLWSHWKGFIENYNPTPFVPPQTGSQAPSNLANKNQPAYRYRRDTAVPYFADVLQQRFPGLTFGGVHTPDNGVTVTSGMNIDRSGTTNPNSDHVSGGAMDIYFKRGTPEQSNQRLIDVQNWLKQQPWAGLVVYEGRSDHQKLGSIEGHVHLSIQIGYQI